MCGEGAVYHQYLSKAIFQFWKMPAELIRIGKNHRTSSQSVAAWFAFYNVYVRHLLQIYQP